MDPNLIARILQMARMRGGQGQGQGPGMMAGVPGASGIPGAGMQMQGGGMPGIGTGPAPMGAPDPAGLYGGGGAAIANRPGGINPMFLPNQQAEQALSTAGQGSAPMNPIIKQLMQHLGMLNMLRNRSAQPFMVGEGQGQGY